MEEMIHLIVLMLRKILFVDVQETISQVVWQYLLPEEHTVIGERPDLTRQFVILILAIIAFAFPDRFVVTV
jgi:hypothetical protein